MRGPLVAVAIGIAATLLYGKGHLGYDAFYSLVWGNDLAHGHLPDFERQVAPTPHPLANIAGVAASVLGDGGVAFLVGLSALAFGTLGYTAYRLGTALFAWPVGLTFAVVLLTREELASQELYTYVDIPYLALVMGAAALEARQRWRGWPVLALLALAGLLRPEAWLLSALYGIWLALGRRELPRVGIALAVAAAPVIWIAFDLVVTGDPFHSLHGTQALAQELERPRSVDLAVLGAPSYIRYILDDPVVMFGGIAGMLMALWLLTERALLPMAMLTASVVSFFGLGLVGLPVLLRYMLLPSAILCLFFAVAVFGWAALPDRRLLRTGWQAGGAVLALISLLAIPANVSRLGKVKEDLGRQRSFQVSLDDLAHRPQVKRAAAGCGRIYVPNHHVIPGLAYWLHRPVADVISAQLERPRRGLLVSPATQGVQLGAALDPNEPKVFEFEVPRSFSAIADNPSWIAYERC
jgi:hypothetical protein